MDFVGICFAQVECPREDMIVAQKNAQLDEKLSQGLELAESEALYYVSCYM